MSDQSTPVTAEADTNVGGILDSAAAFLDQRGVADARLCCELLCARLLGCARLELPMHYSRQLPENYVEAMRRGVRRLAAHEPVQYILGEWDFRGHTLKADRRALIPRPETEQLVELLMQWEPLWQRERPAIADIGTGSGCIAVSIAVERPQARVLALDVSEEALALAAENAQLHGVSDRVRFAPLGLADVLDGPALDAVVANLPYIASGEINGLPESVKSYEPKLALDGGEDGLEIVRETAADATMALRDGGGIFLEIGEAHGAATREMLTDLGFEQVRILNDLAGRVRFATAVLPEV